MQCPVCRAEIATGLNMQGVTMRGNGMNIAVTCPRCGAIFDAAPGRAVRVDTVADRLQVHDLLRGLKVEELQALDGVLREELARPDGEVDFERVSQVSSRVADWLRSSENRREVRDSLTLILTVLTFLLMLSQARHGSDATPAPAPTIVVNLPQTNPPPSP